MQRDFKPLFTSLTKLCRHWWMNHRFQYQASQRWSFVFWLFHKFSAIAVYVSSKASLMPMGKSLKGHDVCFSGLREGVVWRSIWPVAGRFRWNWFNAFSKLVVFVSTREQYSRFSCSEGKSHSMSFLTVKWNHIPESLLRNKWFSRSFWLSGP